MNPDWSLDQYKYIHNKHRIFDFHGYRARIGERKVESSVSSSFDKYDKSIEKSKKSMARFNFLGALTAIGTGIGLIVLVFTTWMLLDSTFKKLDDASSIIKQYKDQNLDFRAFALAKDQEELIKKVKSNEELMSRIYQSLTGTTVNYTLTNENSKTIKILQSQIVDLNKKIEYIEKKNNK